jgi:hypothetical protein
MVQTLEQYKFVWAVVSDIIQERNKTRVGGKKEEILQPKEEANVSTYLPDHSVTPTNSLAISPSNAHLAMSIAVEPCQMRTPSMLDLGWWEGWEGWEGWKGGKGGKGGKVGRE